MDVVVRRVAATDAAALRRVRLAALADSPGAFASTHAAESVLSDDEWLERATAAATGSGRALFLAWAGEEPVGVAGGIRDARDGASVDVVSMWTDARVRRTGVARRLVDAVLAWASSTGTTRIELWVARGNEPAQRLYESIGFRPTGHVQALPSDPCRDELRMALDLTLDLTLDLAST